MSPPDGENPFDQFDETPKAAPSQDNLAPPPPDEQAVAAREAREAAGRVPRRHAQQETPPAPKPLAEGANSFDQFDSDPGDDGIGLMERLRLNRQTSFYRGSLAGSARLALLAETYKTPDAPDISPERKAVNKQQRDEYVKIVADLAAHDQMQPWGTTMEAVAAFGGQLEGAMISPESWIGWGAKGATWMGRAAKSGLQQGGIQAATDPAVQALNISSDVQDEFDPMRTLSSGALGFFIGAAGHMAGEGLGKLVGQLQLRKQLFDLGRADPAFDAPRHAIWALDPNNGIEAPNVSHETITGTPERAPAAGPPHAFSDAVDAEKERLIGEDRSWGRDSEKELLEDTARRSVFRQEAGPIAENVLREHGFEPAEANEIAKFYDRQPGETPGTALEHALVTWYNDLERTSIQVHDGELLKDLEEADRIQAAHDEWQSRQAFRYQEGRLANLGEHGQGGLDRELPGRASFAGERTSHEIPFESGGAAREGGGVPEGGVERPGAAREAGEAGSRVDNGGERGGERAAEGGGAGSAVGTEGARGERVTERTAQGEQTLIPGVAPITDRQRLETEMAKPMRGGDAAPGGMFDQDARAQGDLLGREIPENIQGIAQRKKGGTMAGEPVRQAVPEPPSPTEEVAIRSLQQQSMDLAKALDFPLRQGRVVSRKNAGQFSTKSGVVRVREVPDFDVVSHEAGHAIEAKVGKDLTDLTNVHAAELRPLDYDQTITGRRVNEGFAEFVRLLMTNPAYAEKQAPTFAAEFRQFMALRQPEMMEKISTAASAYKAYLDAPSVDAVSSVRRSVDDNPEGIAKVVESIREDGLPVVIKSVMQKAYDGVLDHRAPIARAVRDLGIAIREREGKLVDLLPGDDPNKLSRLADRSRQAATWDLMGGVRGYHEIAPTGPALADAITEAIGAPSVWGRWEEGKKADFSSYLIARRAEYLWRKFEAGEIPNPPVAFSKADAVQAMTDLAKANPNFGNASDMVHAYTQQVLRKSYEGGLIDADLYAKLLKEEFYVPFNRDMSDKPGAGGGPGGAEGPGTTQVVKRLRGSARDIRDPLESIMAQTLLVNRTIAHNDIVKAFVRLGERAGPEGGKYVEAIPAQEAKKYTADLEQAIANRAKEIGMDPADAQTLIAALGDPAGGPITGSYFKMEQAAAHGEPIVFYREGGQLRAARFMSDKEGHGLYELLTAAPEPVRDIWGDLVSAAASLKRSSIVTNPTFALTNYIRDQFAAGILRSDYVPIYSGIRGIADEFRQGNNAVLYGYAGGVAGGASVGPVEHAFKLETDAMAKKGYAVNRLTSFKGLLELSSFTEAGTRNSIFATVFESGKRKGLSDYDAMVEAAFQAQDILDFSRHGSRTMAIRNYLPFLNAHLQGLDKARRTMIEPITNRIRQGEVFTRDTGEFNNALAAWTKAGAIGGALGAVWAMINWDSEAYRDASPYFKGTHLVVPFGNKVFVVPKPFELGMGFTAGEYAYHALAQKDPRAGRMLAEAAWQAMAPPNPISDMPIITPAIELALGKSMFTGRDIVPEQVQKLPAEQQFTDRTSELAKYLGQQTGISPIKIDYAIGSQFATWGRDVMALSQGVSENSPAASMDDMIFFRRFVKDPTRSSDVTTRFWDFAGRTTGKFNQDVAGYNDLVKDAVTRGQPLSAAQEFLAKLPASEKSFVTLKSGAREDGKAAFTADERRLHPLQNAYDAVTVLNGLRRELATNSQTSWGGQTTMPLNPQERRLLLENVREMAQMFMRNSLVIMGDGGFAGRPMLSVNDTMDKIRHVAPGVADEIANRMATAKVFKPESIQRAWPKLRDELVRSGTDADIRDLGFDAKADGYAFEGQRVRRPGIVRQKIEGAR